MDQIANTGNGHKHPTIDVTGLEKRRLHPDIHPTSAQRVSTFYGAFFLEIRRA